MVALARTLTSLTLATALAGAPALVSVCLAACLPNAAEAAVEAPPDAAVEALPHAPSAHAHHGGGGASSTTVAAASPASQHDARVDGECHDCCASASNAFDHGVAGERPAVATALTPGSGPAHPARVALTPDRRPQPPPVPPPAPVRASLVLRI